MRKRSRDDVIEELEGVGCYLRETKKEFAEREKALKTQIEILNLTSADVKRLRSHVKLLRKAKIIALSEWATTSKRLASSEAYERKLMQGVANIRTRLASMKDDTAHFERERVLLTEELNSYGQLINMKDYRNG